MLPAKKRTRKRSPLTIYPENQKVPLSLSINAFQRFILQTAANQKNPDNPSASDVARDLIDQLGTELGLRYSQRRTYTTYLDFCHENGFKISPPA